MRPSENSLAVSGLQPPTAASPDIGFTRKFSKERRISDCRQLREYFLWNKETGKIGTNSCATRTSARPAEPELPTVGQPVLGQPPIRYQRDLLLNSETRQLEEGAIIVVWKKQDHQSPGYRGSSSGGLCSAAAPTLLQHCPPFTISAHRKLRVCRFTSASTPHDAPPSQEKCDLQWHLLDRQYNRCAAASAAFFSKFRFTPWQKQLTTLPGSTSTPSQ